MQKSTQNALLIGGAIVGVLYLMNAKKTPTGTVTVGPLTCEGPNISACLAQCAVQQAACFISSLRSGSCCAYA